MRTREELTAIDHRHLWHPFTAQSEWTASEPLIIDRGEGAYLIDIEGNRYIDGVSSLWTNVHGHRHPHIDAAVRAQLDKIAHTTLLGLASTPSIELAEQLVKILPQGLSRVFYSDNGSTATETALKMAYQFHQQNGEKDRTMFAGLKDGYHGDTLGSVSVGSIDLFHRVYRPLLFDAVALPAPVSPGSEEEAFCLNQALALLDQYGSQLSAIIIEPLVQGAAGMKMHSVEYIRAIIDRAHEQGVLVIADEVAVGFGRTGTLFAMEQIGVVPDIIALAKGLSGGYLPIAATVTTERIYEGFLGASSDYRQLFHGHTYTGNPLAAAAAIASLELFEKEKTMSTVGTISRALEESLVATAAMPNVREVRQRGVMVGVDLVSEVNGLGHRVCNAARSRGVVIRPLGNTIVLNPPLCLDNAQVTELVQVLNYAIKGTV